MSKIAIKEELLVKLKEIEDENLLQSILNIIEIEQQESKIHFNKEQLNQIEISRKSVRENGISNDEVFKKTNEWLKK